MSPSVAAAVGPLTGQRQEADEDVDEVQEHRRGSIDRVVEGTRETHRPIEIVDDQHAEQRDADPVEDRQSAADVNAEHAEDRNREVADDESDEPTQKPRAPALQTLGDHRSNDAEHEHERGRDREHANHAGIRVHRDNGAEEQTERAGHERVAQQREERMTAGVEDDRTDDAHHQDAEREAQELPLAGEVPVQRDSRHQSREDDSRRHERGQADRIQVLAHRMSDSQRRSLTAPDAIRKSHAKYLHT